MNWTQNLHEIQYSCEETAESEMARLEALRAIAQELETMNALLVLLTGALELAVVTSPPKPDPRPDLEAAMFLDGSE